jgi:hypothetical protein
LNQDGTAKRPPHNCHVYERTAGGRIKNPRPFYPPGARQEPPPGPARSSRASQIHEALESLGIAQGNRSVWPPPALEIRAIFLDLSKSLHPDKNPGDAAAEARYKEITAAYTLLKGEGIA